MNDKDFGVSSDQQGSWSDRLAVCCCIDAKSNRHPARSQKDNAFSINKGQDDNSFDHDAYAKNDQDLNVSSEQYGYVLIVCTFHPGLI